MRSPVGRDQLLPQARRVEQVLAVGAEAARPISSERTAFCSASLKVRPMAMASPTDFIWVPSIGLVAGNFSKAQRGILTTT